jgi:hypothetical protein
LSKPDYPLVLKVPGIAEKPQQIEEDERDHKALDFDKLA